MKDFLGKNLKVGDEVVYPTRRFSSMWMNYGVVEGVGETKLLVRRVSPEGDRRVWISEPSRVTIVK